MKNFCPVLQSYYTKKNRKKLFSPYKISDSENFMKVSQNPNKVARDTQGLPTVPHNDFWGLNFKGLVSIGKIVKKRPRKLNTPRNRILVSYFGVW